MDGRRAFILQRGLPAVESSEPDRDTIRSLPSFDPFMLGHREKGHLIDGAHYKRVYREAGWLSPVGLSNKHVVGTWAFRRRTGSLDVVVSLFLKVTRDIRRKIKDETQDLARFLDVPSLDFRLE